MGVISGWCCEPSAIEEMILNLEIVLSARVPGALQHAHLCHSSFVQVRTEALCRNSGHRQRDAA